MEKTVASTLLNYLHHRGVRHIFGVVGREASAILFDEEQGIEFILTRHEFTAGIMADVLARLTGRPQVCFSTLGPGVTNLATAVASACLDRSPVIALSAQAESYDAIYNQTHQCLDSVSIMKPMTKFASELVRPDELVPLLEQAFEVAMSELRGPSFLSLPIDLLKKNVVEGTEVSPFKTVSSSISYQAKQSGCFQALDEVAALFSVARHPLLVIGNAVIRNGLSQQIRLLCEANQIPLVTAYNAKGVLPHNHLLNYGAISGYMDGILNCNALDEIFGPVDLILTIGYDYAEDLRPSMWTRGVNKKVVRIASQPNAARQIFRPYIDIVNSLEDSLTYLQKILSDQPRKELHDVRTTRQTIEKFTRDTTTYPDGLRVNQVVGQINQVLEDGILVTDVGFFRHYAVIFGQINHPNGFITSAGCSTFGFGLPAAMAAKIFAPDKPVVLICGDGGFHSNSQDLETVARYNLPIVIVVLNNNCNGLIRFYQNLGHHRTYAPAVEFGQVDFVELAKANGIAGFSISSLSDLQSKLQEAVHFKKPVLLEIPIAYGDMETNAFKALDV